MGSGVADVLRHHRAAQLTQRWNQKVWNRVARLLTEDHPPAPAVADQHQRQRQVRLTQIRVDDLVIDYQVGASVAAVARKYGVCLQTATAHLDRRGVTIRPQHGIPEDQLTAAQALRDQGWTYTQIGQTHGTGRTTVSNQLRDPHGTSTKASP